MLGGLGIGIVLALVSIFLGPIGLGITLIVLCMWLGSLSDEVRRLRLGPKAIVDPDVEHARPQIQAKMERYARAAQERQRHEGES